MVDEAGRVGMNVGINSRPRASKYRMLLIILPHGLGKEQVFVCLFVLFFLFHGQTEPQVAG